MGIGSGSPLETSGEDVVFDLIKRHTNHPLCIFDVGANRGQYLHLVLDRLRGHDFGVHCFEPSHDAFKLLADVAGDDTRVTLNNFGIGSSPGEATLYYDQPASPTASLTKRNLDHLHVEFSKSETVAISTIDEYCAEHEIDRINLLKMDIEGHELEALHGASAMLGRGAVDMLTFEFGGCNIDSRTYLRDFWYLVASYDMNMFRITPSRFLQPLLKYEEAFEQFGNTNYVAVRRG